MDRQVQVIYDARTGAVLGSHVALVEPGAETPDVIAAMTDVLEGHELAVIATDGPLERPVRVDLEAHALAPAWALSISAPRSELDGDGADSVVLEISALDEHGAVDRGFEDAIRITTSRGRLSERGGRARMKHGVARLTLTSAPETVNRVVVTADDPAGRATSATLELELA
jgi:hypothetical protein